MKLQFKCGCGLVNHNREDWFSHWKYGLNGKLRAVVLFLKTEIQVVK